MTSDQQSSALLILFNKKIKGNDYKLEKLKLSKNTLNNN